MAHLHSVYDNDTHFKIDPATRQIANESGKVILMQNDHNSERFTFEIPRYIDGHDMSVCNKVEVHFINLKADKTEKHADVYPVEDLQISPASEDVVICSWLISQNATKYAGSLNFVLRYACLTDSVIDYQWYTDIHKGISVSESISNTESVAIEYSDILEAWEKELIANGGVTDERIEQILENYIVEHPEATAPTDEQVYNVVSTYLGEHPEVTAPTDEQVVSAVSVYLDEHPEATAPTVADGSVTPQKLSFYKAKKEMVNLGDLDYSEVITQQEAQAIGLWYYANLSESVEVDGNFAIFSDTETGIQKGEFAQFTPLYYDENGEIIAIGNVQNENVISVSVRNVNNNIPYTVAYFIVPENAVTMKWYARDGATKASAWKILDFANLPEVKSWVSEDAVDLLDQNNAVRGNIATNYENRAEHSLRLSKTVDLTSVDFIPTNYTEITKGEDGTQNVDITLFLDAIELGDHTEFYLAVTSEQGNNTQLSLYGQHGLFAYDENWNPLTARSLQYTPSATDYVTAEKLLTRYDQTENGYGRGVYYYHVTVDQAVKYLLPVGPSAGYKFRYSYGQFNPVFSTEETVTFEAPLSVENYVKDVLRPDYYTFRQIGRLVPNGGCNYVAWNHNTLHYDATRNLYVMTMRGSNVHGGSVNAVKFVTIDPVTLEATTSDIVVGGVTVVWVNGFTIDDSGKYMMVCHVNEVQHYVTSDDGGANWTDGGEIVVDTSGATNIDTTKYNYAKFFNLHRLSTGTLLATYDDTVSPTNTKYQFVARSTDGVNWTLIEIAADQKGSCEASFYEHNGTILMVGRKNTYQYDVTDHVTGESYNNAVISYSYDDGQSWTTSVSSETIRANVQNVSIREHDGIVELMAMNRDFNKYPRGYIYHYTATPEEALADRFTLREVFQCNAYGAGDVTGGGLAFDRYGHGLFAYSDNHGSNSNYDYLHFLYGAKANTPSVCADSVASEFLPYSGKKTQELIDALTARIDAIGG